MAVAYIRICLQYFGQDSFIFRKILAITFTNKAVGEMKSRILFFLRCLSLPEGRLDKNGRKQRADMLPLLADICSEEELSRRADIILKNILADYSRFSVITIDKFYQQVVHAFAFELNLPANYRLELDEQLVTKQMVDVLLAKLGYDDTLTAFVLEYLDHRLEEGQRWKPDRDLAVIARELFQEDAMEYAPMLSGRPLEAYQRIIRKLKAEVRRMEQEVALPAREALAALPPLVDPYRDFRQGKNGFGAWLQNVAKGDMQKASAPNSYVQQAAEGDNWVTRTQDARISDAILSVAPQLKEAYARITEYVRENLSAYIWYGYLLKYIYPFALLGEFRRVAEEIAESTGQLLIGESARCISRVISSEEVPFIYERLGERFAYFFIDEFQDTSRLQWRNLLPLVAEGLSKEVAGGESGRLVLFGDAKQAIYRFRSGDVRQFVHLSQLDREAAADGEEILKHGFKAVPMEENFRSKQEIIRFNNGFFQWVRQRNAENAPVYSVYEGLEQHVPGEGGERGGGGAELLAVDTKLYKYNEFSPELTADIVMECLKEGFAFSNIAVLARSNDLASRVAVVLTSRGVPVVSSESLLLSASPEVRFMTACLQFVRNPGHEVAKAHIAAYLSQKREPAALLAEALPLTKNIGEFNRLMERWGYNLDLNLLRRLNLYERFRYLADLFGLDRTDPYLMAFGEVVWGYHEQPEQGDENFLEYWEERQSHFSLSNPDGVNAVQVLTIHKAKGLAFPVVIYPMKASRKSLERELRWMRLEPPFRADGDAVLDVAMVRLGKDLLKTDYAPCYAEECEMSRLDRLNIDYVAFTRAEQRLYLIVPAEQDDAEDSEGPEAYFRHLDIPSVADACHSGVKRYHYPSGSCFGAADSGGGGGCVEPAVAFPDSAVSELPPLAFDNSEVASGGEAEWGTIVHQYLSQMYRREDVDVLCKTVNKSEALKPGERDFLLRLLANIREQPEADCLFGDEGTFVRNEVEILLPGKIMFRLDRLLIKGKNVRLIDYKTGQWDESHENQLKGYIDGLRQIGYNVTDARLVYIAPETAYIRSLPISLR